MPLTLLAVDYTSGVGSCELSFSSPSSHTNPRIAQRAQDVSPPRDFRMDVNLVVPMQARPRPPS